MVVAESKQWVRNGRFSISAIRSELPIYSNGLNMLKVLVYISPLDANGDALSESDLPDSEVRQSLKLIDYDDSKELIKSSDDDSPPTEEGWYYADRPNGFDSIPNMGFPDSVKDELYSLEGADASVRVIDFYVHCLFQTTSRAKRVAVKVTLPGSGQVFTTAFGGTLSSHVDFRTIKPRNYGKDDCVIEYSPWKELDTTCESSINSDERPAFYAKQAFIRLKENDKSFIKSKITPVNSDDGKDHKTPDEIKQLERVFYNHDLQWLRRYCLGSRLVFTYYVWDINKEEGDIFGEAPNRYKLLGRSYRYCLGKIKFPISLSPQRVSGSLPVVIVKQTLSGSSGQAQNYPINVVLYEQYGNACRVKLKMFETDLPEAQVALIDV